MYIFEYTILTSFSGNNTIAAEFTQGLLSQSLRNGHNFPWAFCSSLLNMSVPNRFFFILLCFTNIAVMHQLKICDNHVLSKFTSVILLTFAYFK